MDGPQHCARRQPVVRAGQLDDRNGAVGWAASRCWRSSLPARGSPRGPGPPPAAEGGNRPAPVLHCGRRTTALVPTDRTVSIASLPTLGVTDANRTWLVDWPWR